MRNNKIFVVSVLFLVLALNFVSASNYHADNNYYVEHQYYDSNGNYDKKVVYVFDRDYQENPDRFPVSDYSDGYTYRISKEYLGKRYDDDRLNNHLDDRNYYGYRPSGEINYYEYQPYLNSYEKKSCYNYPPKGKLFYIKCDFY